MTEGKPVRKYSRWKYRWKQGKYLAHHGAVTSFLVASGTLCMLGVSLSGIAVIAGLLCFIFGLVGGLSGSGTEMFLFAYGCLVFAGVAGLAAYFAYHHLFCRVENSESPLLNPTPPEKNSVLPDAATLVRASAPDMDAQRAELLRASTIATETPPEQLLRATSSAGE